MKYFLDTEFSERGPLWPIKLLSIGIVAEDGREFYAVAEHHANECNDWVIANVLPQLLGTPQKELGEIGRMVRRFIADGAAEKPEFWGYYADYDWVVFCQMFGSMINLPKGWPMYCRDIKQLADSLGNPKLPEQTSKEHNALNDAHWNKLAWEFLQVR